ncbi:hypothetical protein [Sporisorium scitamineum]|uniref:DUF7888 domain-containing protein n=1 Tax=Sporisorium scitamineum TaxID=49012 RepID=A0A0F7S6T0_9BASI|nr:hypothetical protein [Sporisorium scitamineum]
MYQINRKYYDNITAAVCFSGKYDMASWDPSSYVEISKPECSYKDDWGWLVGSVSSNSFRAKSPGGYKNLAILKDDEGCTWNHDQRNLTCVA